MMTDAIAENFFTHVLNVYINPEIARREEQNRLSKPFLLCAFQVVIKLGQQTEIRFNNEVRAIAEVTANKITETGETISMSDVNSIQRIKLTENDSNAAHITGILLPNSSWHFECDFRYNSSLRAERLIAAEEFFEAASNALEKKHYRAFHENLFACMESTIIAMMIGLPVEEFLTTKGHGTWHKMVNHWSKLGNTDSKNSKLFNTLSNNRSKARYSFESFSIDPGQAKGMLDIAKSFIESVRNSLCKV